MGEFVFLSDGIKKMWYLAINRTEVATSTVISFKFAGNKYYVWTKKWEGTQFSRNPQIQRVDIQTYFILLEMLKLLEKEPSPFRKKPIFFLFIFDKYLPRRVQRS